MSSPEDLTPDVIAPEMPMLLDPDKRNNDDFPTELPVDPGTDDFPTELPLDASIHVPEHSGDESMDTISEEEDCESSLIQVSVGTPLCLTISLGTCPPFQIFIVSVEYNYMASYFAATQSLYC